ncbi:MAG: Lsr2 family protein [Actinomycetota bacterium]|jgi:hypothetical protein|nr:Lsr2 family protein [Actinomycetota bacterium]
MAQKVSVLLVDDIDGSEAEETISFSLDGARYEIDLNGAHAQELREQVGRYVKAARKVTGSSGRPARVRRASADDKNKEVRDWARDQGLEVNDRGRIPAHIVAKYEAENSK